MSNAMNPITDLETLQTFIGEDVALRSLRDDALGQLDDDPGHDLSHALRVALWTIRLGGTEVCPREAIAAALMHDWINLPKDHPQRREASAMSAQEAEQRLPELGFNDDATARIVDAILTHSFSRGLTPRSALGDALQDADRLEALGAIGLMRNISTGVQLGARYFHPSDPWAEQRALDDKAYSVDHHFVKLLRLPDTMRTKHGRQEAERRAEVLRIFLRALGTELGVSPPPLSRHGKGSAGAGEPGKVR